MMNKNDMPMGFAMALAMNLQAMQNFATLGEEQKKQIIDGTHSIISKEEMKEYVENIASNSENK